MNNDRIKAGKKVAIVAIGANCILTIFNIAIGISDNKILLCVIVINLIYHHTVEHIIGIKHPVALRLLIVAEEATTRQKINSIARINAVLGSRANEIWMYHPFPSTKLRTCQQRQSQENSQK